MSDNTNYSKERMLDLADKIANSAQKISDAREQVTTNVNLMENNWIVGDEGATKTIESIKNQKRGLDSFVNEGLDLINEFKNIVTNQVDKYAEAEDRINKKINN